MDFDIGDIVQNNNGRIFKITYIYYITEQFELRDLENNYYPSVPIQNFKKASNINIAKWRIKNDERRHA